MFPARNNRFQSSLRMILLDFPRHGHSKRSTSFSHGLHSAEARELQCAPLQSGEHGEGACDDSQVEAIGYGWWMLVVVETIKH